MQLNSVSGLLLGRPGLSGPAWYLTWSWRVAKQSVATLARLEPTVLAGGHGTPMTGADTASVLRAFADRLCGRAKTGGTPRRVTAPARMA